MLGSRYAIRHNAAVELPACYRMYRLYRFQVLSSLAIGIVIAIGLFAGQNTGKAAPIWFVVVWVVALIWNGYWWSFRIAYSLKLDGEQLMWRAPLRTGLVSSGEVVRLRPFKGGSNIEVLEVASGSPVLVFVRKGFKDFTEALTTEHPELPVRLGLQARIAERFPGRSGFRCGGDCLDDPGHQQHQPRHRARRDERA
ncbi:MAG: hypothetical protein ACRDJU_11660 [Actinomycetota bacterium]